MCELLSVRSADVGGRWVESTDEQGYDYYEYQLVDGESILLFVLNTCWHFGMHVFLMYLFVISIFLCI